MRSAQTNSGFPFDGVFLTSTVGLAATDSANQDDGIDVSWTDAARVSLRKPLEWVIILTRYVMPGCFRGCMALTVGDSVLP